MRQVGMMKNKNDALRFVAVLVLNEIAATCELEEQSAAIWVHDEDRLALAKELFQEFQADPGNPRYAEADRLAEKRIREHLAERERAQRNVVVVRRRWKSAGNGNFFAPVVWVLLGIAGLIALVTGFAPHRHETVYRTFVFADPLLPAANGSYYRSDSTAGIWRSIQRGEVWRIWTPMFLHFGVMHIVFNALWMYSLGGQMEDRRGTWFFLFFVLVTAAVSNISQALMTGPAFGGLSGVGYAIFGYMWIRGRSDRPDLALPAATIQIGFAFLILCLLQEVPGFADMLSFLPHVANTAHVAGVLGGIALGWLDRG